MICASLREMLEAQFGKSIRYSQECEALSESIFETTGERLSVTTLKRLLGFTTMSVAPRSSTMDILAKYIGYSEGFSSLPPELREEEEVSMFADIEGVVSDELDEGTLLKVTYNPSRSIVLRYLGEQQYCVEDAKGCKLCKGDIVKVANLSVRFELLASQVVRDGVSLGGYRAAKDGGILTIEILD